MNDVVTRRLASTTAAPARASVLANWAPRPLDAPVIKATRPERSMLYAIEMSPQFRKSDLFAVPIHRIKSAANHQAPAKV
jgi:hypothetical protein